jgi:hypothetical protein
MNASMQKQYQTVQKGRYHTLETDIVTMLLTQTVAIGMVVTAVVQHAKVLIYTIVD